MLSPSASEFRELFRGNRSPGDRQRSWATVVLILCLLAALTSCAKSSSARKVYTIAVIPQGSTYEYWKSIHAGAAKAVQDLAGQGMKVDIIWKGPLREGDREEQTRIVEGFVAQGVSGIVLVPLDRRALVRPVEEAAAAGIPTLIVDSALDSTKIVSYVSTDNTQGGVIAADRIGTLLKGQGKVLLLRFQEGVASTHAREEGFVQELKTRFPKIELISSNQFAGPTRETARQASENLLTRYGGQIQGIFTPNESSTVGMLLALQDINQAGKVALVGFDLNDTFITALGNGQLQGVIVQNPFRMGELGVKMMVEHLQGMPVEPRIDTGVLLITQENLNRPETQELVHPPLSKYLGE